ncbi:MAG TPA: hypothetical protein VGP92_15195 [Acidimicrobiia bacterium]|nr:hypothetical protein [Acidimicrobiia bacterium]
MATSRARSSDIKLIVSATVAVVLAGLFIAGGMLIATSSGSKNPVCGQLNLGKASDVRHRLDSQGPSFVTGGSNCGFWIALANGDIVAYRVKQPSGCALNLRNQASEWVCGGRTIAAADLATYNVSILKVGSTDAVIVDLGPASGASTTATSSTTTTTTG